jgi:ParB family transcriptional regulator, chromosome partitioning protein
VAHVAKSLAAKPKLAQISTGYDKLQGGSAVALRGKYVPIHYKKSKDKEEARRL